MASWIDGDLWYWKEIAGKEKLLQELAEMASHRDVTLLCWELDDRHCHRRLLVEKIQGMIAAFPKEGQRRPRKMAHNTLRSLGGEDSLVLTICLHGKAWQDVSWRNNPIGRNSALSHKTLQTRFRERKPISKRLFIRQWRCATGKGRRDGETTAINRMTISFSTIHGSLLENVTTVHHRNDELRSDGKRLSRLRRYAATRQ